MIKFIVTVGIFFSSILTTQTHNILYKPISQTQCYILDFADNDNIKEAVIPKLNSADIHLDGKLNEQCWKQSAILDDFRLLEHKLKPGQSDMPSQKTLARMFYTEKCIYIGVICFEKNIDKVKNIWKNYGDPVWNEDSIEIFLDTNYDRCTYYHLACNCIGTRNSAYYGTIIEKASVNQEGFLMSATGTKERKVLPDKPWPMSWKVATSKSNDSWTVEIAIPFKFLGMRSAPEDYTVWGFNIGRERYAGKQEFSNWQKLGYGFNEVQYYGKIFFNKAPNFRIKSLKIPCPVIGKNSLKIFPKPKTAHTKTTLKIGLQAIPKNKIQSQLLKYNIENNIVFNVDKETKALKIIFDENGTIVPYHTYPVIIDKIFTADLNEDTIDSDSDCIEIICNVKLDKSLLKQSSLSWKIESKNDNVKILAGEIRQLPANRFKLTIPLKTELQEGEYNIKLKLDGKFSKQVSLPFEAVEF